MENPDIKPKKRGTQIDKARMAGLVPSSTWQVEYLTLTAWPSPRRRRAHRVILGSPFLFSDPRA